MTSRAIALAFAAASLLSAQSTMDPWWFSFAGPLPEWKNGLPVGNGRIGAQVWGTGPTIYLTLHRGDIWDLRYSPNTSPDFTYRHLQELVKQRAAGRIQSEMSPDVNPLANVVPSQISAGRLKITLPAGTTVRGAGLDMQSAEVVWELIVNGKVAKLRVTAPADPPVIVATLEGATATVDFEPLVSINPKLRAQLKYPDPVYGKTGPFEHVTQTIPESGYATVAWTTRQEPGAWSVLLTIPPQDRHDPVATATFDLNRALHQSTPQLRADHRKWWNERWSRSSVEIPDPLLQRLWRNGIYKLASSSYGAAPAALQGLWPPDGEIPPWRGDYHNNMNVQETYWPAYSSNQLDLADPLERWMYDRVAPENEALTKRFFGVDGLWIGTALDVKGRLLGGSANWFTVQYWLGAGGWLGQHAWWRYAYTGDREYLRTRAYPFLKRLATFYANILQEGPDRRLHIPLSSSPEFFSNDLQAWTPDPTADLAIVRELLRDTGQAAAVLGIDADLREKWRDIAERLAPYPADGRTGLYLQPGAPYNHTHRHPSHLFAIFPGEDLTVEGTPADRELINRSIQNWIFQGTGEWTGWSYPYASLIASRVGRANQALETLRIYERAFIWPNGFHVNGDWRGYAYSSYTYQPFTMEAECAFTAAVNAMLLQDWGGKIRVFPAVPAEWPNASFEHLRARPGVLVSAEMRNGKFVRAKLESDRMVAVTVVLPGDAKARSVEVSPERPVVLP